MSTAIPNFVRWVLELLEKTVTGSYDVVFQVVTTLGAPEFKEESEETDYRDSPEKVLALAQSHLSSQADSTFLLLGNDAKAARHAIPLGEVKAAELTLERECVFASLTPEDMSRWLVGELNYERLPFRTEVRVYKLSPAEFLQIATEPFRQLLEP